MRQSRRIALRPLGMFALGLLGVASTVTGQPATEPRDDHKRVVLHLSGGAKESGWLAALSDSSITLDTGKEFVTLRRAQLERIDILTNPQIEFGVLGLCTSGFIVTLFTSTEFPRDTHLSTELAESPMSTFAVTLLGSLPGGVAGAIADRQRHPDRRTFHLEGEVDTRYAEWSRLERYIATAGWRRWNINVQSASVFPSAAPVLRDRQRTAGYETLTTPSYDSPGWTELAVDLAIENDNEFLWLRRIEASYGLRRDLDVGIMMIYGSEVQTAGKMVLDLPGQPNGFRHVGERITGAGYYLAAHYRPLAHTTRLIDLSLGAGLGLSHSTFVRVMEQDPGGDPNERDERLTSARDEVTAISPTVAVTLDLKVAVTHGVHLGIGTDAMVAPSMEVPANAAFGIAGGTVPLRTLSVGVTFGYRF